MATKSLKLRECFFLLLSAALAVSCARTLEQGMAEPVGQLPIPPDSVSFTAWLDTESRTQLGKEGNILWNDTDKVRVFNADTPEGAEFSLTGGAGTTVGTFSGPDIGDGPFYAIYPSDAAGLLTGSALSVTIPASQTYVPGSFGPGANLAAGKADALDKVHFYNLTGFVALTLTGDKTITGIRISSFQAEPLSGTAIIDGWDNAFPSLTLDAGQTGEPFREVYLDCGTGVTLTSDGTVFCLAVPAGTLAGGYRIEVYDTEGLAMVKYAKAGADNQVERSKIVRMPALAYTPGYKTGFILSEAVGAFSNAAADGVLAARCDYVEGRSQYSYLNTSATRTLRLQDWEKGYALGFTMPFTLSQGKTAAVTISSLGLPAIASAQVEKMRVVKTADDRVWMLDPATKNGYILMMVED